MFVLSSLLLLAYIVISSVYSDRDISWFKETQYHNKNILKISNSWIECPSWSDTYNSVGAGDGLTIEMNDFGTSKTIDITSVWRFNFTALCITLYVPLDWDDQTLYIDEMDIINYTITRVYARNDIENVANNGAFWLLPGTIYKYMYFYK